MGLRKLSTACFPAFLCNHGANYDDAGNACANLELGGLSDWRLPEIKEVFSIINFAGTIDESDSTTPSNPYVFKEYFDIDYDTEIELSGTHQIQMMGQTWTATTRPDDPRSNYVLAIVGITYSVRIIMDQVRNEATRNMTTEDCLRHWVTKKI